MLLWSFLFVAAGTCQASSPGGGGGGGDPLILKTDLGTIRGSVSTSEPNGLPYASFMSIPYAKVS